MDNIILRERVIRWLKEGESLSTSIEIKIDSFADLLSYFGVLDEVGWSVEEFIEFINGSRDDIP